MIVSAEPTKATGITLTGEQQRAADMALEFLGDKNQKLFRIGGYAGTGKTTIAKTIVASSDMNPIVCAFTGKAAHVLRTKGLGMAKTIHSSIYKYDEKTGEFYRVPVPNGDYFLIDEGSMVSRELWDDVQSFNLPVVLIGDPGQLEPIGNNPNLMLDTDVILEEIHRQAAESEIIQMANAVRRGWEISHGICKDVSILPRGDFLDGLAWADQVLCGFNKTRVRANKMIRAAANRKEILEPGERIVVLKNDRHLGVFNGQMFTVERVRDIGEWTITADLVSDDGIQRKRMPIWPGHFHRDKTLPFDELRKIRERVFADYGYAVTVHKFQGSEADNVLVIDEQCSVWDARRWRYTAITRAAKQLRYCIR